MKTTIVEGVTLNIARTYQDGMSCDQVFEVACGAWIFGKNKPSERLEYALAIAGGKVRGVYRIDIDKWERCKDNNRKWEFKQPDTKDPEDMILKRFAKYKITENMGQTFCYVKLNRSGKAKLTKCKCRR